MSDYKTYREIKAKMKALNETKRFPPLPKRHSSTWTIEEDLKLTKHYSENMSYFRIGKLLQRSEGGIAGRISVLRAAVRASENLPMNLIKERLEIGQGLRNAKVV